jgi:hypothetical protein
MFQKCFKHLQTICFPFLSLVLCAYHLQSTQQIEDFLRLRLYVYIPTTVSGTKWMNGPK